MWAVFGCGGDRDAKKRPIMGKLALELADILVVTSDNPRSEDPDTIIRDIETGFSDNPQHKEIYTISDRQGKQFNLLSPMHARKMLHNDCRKRS